MEFSEEIKTIRQRSLLSQEAFAQVFGVSFTIVNRWKSGKTALTYKTIKTIKNNCDDNNIAFNTDRLFIKEGG